MKSITNKQTSSWHGDRSHKHYPAFLICLLMLFFSILLFSCSSVPDHSKDSTNDDDDDTANDDDALGGDDADTGEMEKLMGWDGDCLMWEYAADGAQSLYLLELRRGIMKEAFGEDTVYRLILSVDSDPESGLRNEVLRDIAFKIGDGEIKLMGGDYRGAYGSNGFCKYEPHVVFMKPTPDDDAKPVITANDSWITETEINSVSENHTVTIFNKTSRTTPSGKDFDAYEIKHQYGGVNIDTYWLAPEEGFVEMTLNLKRTEDKEKKQFTLRLNGIAGDKCTDVLEANEPSAPESCY